MTRFRGTIAESVEMKTDAPQPPDDEGGGERGEEAADRFERVSDERDPSLRENRSPKGGDAEGGSIHESRARRRRDAPKSLDSLFDMVLSLTKQRASFP